MTVTSNSNLDVGGTLATRVVSPAAMGAAENDYAGADGFSFARLTPNAVGTSITGFANGTDGRLLRIVNLGNAAVTVAHQSAASIAANRVITSTGAGFVLVADATMTLIYDSVATRWRQMS